MSDPIVTNAESFCNALYESASNKSSPVGWINAGDLMAAVENLTFSKEDLHSKALSTLREEAAKAKAGSSKILSNQSKTLKLIAQVYAEASKTATKTEKLEELGKILVSSGIGPSTRSTAKIGLKRFQSVQIGKSFQKGIINTLLDSWNSGLTKVKEYLTFLRHLTTHLYINEMLNEVSALHNTIARGPSDNVKDFLMRGGGNVMGFCQMSLMKYLEVPPDHEEQLVTKLEKRLVELKICTQKQIGEGIANRLTSDKKLMQELQSKDSALYALLGTGQELTMLFADPLLFSEEQINDAIQTIGKAWQEPSTRKEILDNITRQLALGSTFIGHI